MTDARQANDERSGGGQIQATAMAADPAQARAPRSVLATATSVGKALLGAAATILVRMVGFGVLGFFAGVLAFVLERAFGLLDHSWGPWQYLAYLLLVAYVAAGAFLVGLAGMWRGIGRAAINLVEKHGLARHILERLFDRAAALVSGTATPEVLRTPLPLQRLRELLRQTSAAYADSDDLEGEAGGLTRTIGRRLKRWLCGLIEARVLDIIGEESRDMNVVELTLARIRERAEGEIDDRVVRAIDDARGRKALLFGALFAGAVALPPLVLMILRRLS